MPCRSVVFGRLRPRLESDRAGSNGAGADAEKLPARQPDHERDPTFVALA